MPKKTEKIQDNEIEDILTSENLEEDQEEEEQEEKRVKIVKKPLTAEESLDNFLLLANHGYHSSQLIRIEENNRIRDIVRRTLEGIGFNQLEEKKENTDKKEGVYSDKELFQLWNIAKSKGLITQKQDEYMQYCLSIAKNMQTQEKEFKIIITKLLKDNDIFTQFLSKIRGMAELSSSYMIKTLGDCSKFSNVGKLWAYCGYDVRNGKAPKRVKGSQIDYNAKFRSQMFVISQNLMKLNKGFYREVYQTEKEKLSSRIYETGVLNQKYGKVYKNSDCKLSKGHVNSMCLRKIAKLLLSNYWECSKELSNQPIEKFYVEQVLNHSPEHIVHWKDVIAKENTCIIKKAEKIGIM